MSLCNRRHPGQQTGQLLRVLLGRLQPWAVPPGCNIQDPNWLAFGINAAVKQRQLVGQRPARAGTAHNVVTIFFIEPRHSSIKTQYRLEKYHLRPVNLKCATLLRIISSKRRVIRRNFLCEAVWAGGLQHHLDVWRLYPCTPCLIEILGQEGQSHGLVWYGNDA
ncbi:hypothetical protein KCV06_g300, partial [Aureobasidium melanogenum]